MRGEFRWELMGEGEWEGVGVGIGMVLGVVDKGEVEIMDLMNS